jgi:hypothetical protein
MEENCVADPGSPELSLLRTLRLRGAPMSASLIAAEYNLDGDDPVDGFPQDIPVVLEALVGHEALEAVGDPDTRHYSLSSFGKRFAEDAGRCVWSLGPGELGAFATSLADDTGVPEQGLPRFCDLESALRQLLTYVTSDLASESARVIPILALERGAVRALDLPVTRQLKLFEVWCTFEAEHVRCSLIDGLWIGLHRARFSPGRVDSAVVDLLEQRGALDRASAIRATAGLLIRALRAVPRDR